ncbi:MAG: hypothetical protein AAGB12_14795 [Pseudomonadota bacterium]
MQSPKCNLQTAINGEQATFGHLLLTNDVCRADDWPELQLEICAMIYRNLSEARNKENIVENFVNQLLAMPLSEFDDEDIFIEPSQALNREKLERFVVIQFITSTKFVNT